MFKRWLRRRLEAVIARWPRAPQEKAFDDLASKIEREQRKRDALSKYYARRRTQGGVR